MDAVLALLIAIVQLDLRYRTSSALVPSITVAETIAFIVVASGVLAALATRGVVAARAIGNALAGGRASTLYLAWLPCAAIAGLAVGSVDGLHAFKDMMPAGVLLGLCLSLPATRGRLQRAEIALCVVGIAAAILAISQAMVGGPYLMELSETGFKKQAWDMLAPTQNPVAGPFAHPNGLALFLVPIGILSAGRTIDALREERAWRVALIHAICAVTAILAIVLGVAKMGTGILLIAIGIRGACEVTRLRCTPPRALSAFLLLVASLGGVIFVTLNVAQMRGMGLDPSTLVERWLLDVSAARFLAEHPGVLVLGGGWQAFIEATPRGLQVHNEFLGQVMRFGVLGGLLFLAVIASSFRGLDQRSWSYALALSGLAALLLVEPADGAQAQGAIMTILGLCALRHRVAHAEAPIPGAVEGQTGRLTR